MLTTFVWLSATVRARESACVRVCVCSVSFSAWQKFETIVCVRQWERGKKGEREEREGREWEREQDGTWVCTYVELNVHTRERKNDEVVTQKTSTMLISQALVIFYDATYEEKKRYSWLFSQNKCQKRVEIRSNSSSYHKFFWVCVCLCWNLYVWVWMCALTRRSGLTINCLFYLVVAKSLV